MKVTISAITLYFPYWNTIDSFARLFACSDDRLLRNVINYQTAVL